MGAASSRLARAPYAPAIGALLLALALGGCGGGGHGSTGNLPASGGAAVPGRQSGGGAPTPEDLGKYLQAEFELLGIDPDKVTAAAPRGDSNAVFDLAAAIVDLDGPGGDPPAGIELNWTERCIGDYDQNGLVNASDLTPLGMKWQESVEYDNPAAHEGCAYWPAGDPDDGKTGSAATLAASPVGADLVSALGRDKLGPYDPPLRMSQAAGSGAYNWRLARIDGNANGLIEIADITPIAQHFKERLSGYRIYRKGPLDADWMQLPNPDDAQSEVTVAHPAAQANAPVRYSFMDDPSYPGVYEYYVIAYAPGSTGVSAMEADAWSNIAQVTLILDTVDVYPPVWQGTAGIAGATANDDGTVTVDWGTAIDEEHPPAPASPPVTYNVYYAAESPLDFAGAAKAEDVTSPWTSPQLVDGREYYFAVRAQDSAPVPNEDKNTNELGATITGGIVDEEPPVWVETYQYRHDNGSLEEVRLGGIQRLEVGNGKLTIWRAEAEDELSPPVHYDLYFISDRVADKVYDGLWPREDAQVIHDIPEVYELEWENRHGVHLAIQARDSAEPENTARPPQYEEEYTSAPTSLRKIPIDMNMPLFSQYTESDVTNVKSDSAFDRLTHTLYVFYSLLLDPSVVTTPIREVWALELDMDTAEWDGVLVGSWNRETEGIPIVSSASTAPDGTPWFIVTVDDIHSTKATAYYYRRTGPGSYEVWDPPDRQGGWNGGFSFDNYPVFYVVDTSMVNPDGQFRLSYRWWDEDSQVWHQEQVCDPSGYEARSYLRPDGVVQLITEEDLALGAPSVPLYGHIHERQPDGTWTEVLRTDGNIVLPSQTVPYWDSEWAWTMQAYWGEQPWITDFKFLVYGTAGGYFWIEHILNKPDGSPCCGNWPAGGGGYHSAPTYIFDGTELTETSSGYFEVWFNRPTHGALRDMLPHTLKNGYAFDLSTGWWARLQPSYDPRDRTLQLQLFTADNGQSMYDLDD